MAEEIGSMATRRWKRSPPGGEHEHARAHVARLYDVSKVLARFEGVAETLPAVLDLASSRLDLRMAILLDGRAPRPRTFVWHASEVPRAELRDCLRMAREHYAYLAGEIPSAEWIRAGSGADESDSSLEAMQGSAEPSLSRITLPLSVDRGHVFGVLRVQSRQRLDEVGLAFLNAVANQLAVALDRHEARRKEVLLREEAEAARAEAQEAVKARDAFISVASHELRAPLTALTLQLGLLDRLAAASPDRRIGMKVAFARRQVARLHDLIERLLDVSRVTSGRLDLQLGPVDLRTVVQEVVARARDDAAAAGSPLVLAAPAAVPGVWDRMRLDQVVTNLVSNAIKYGRGRPIEIVLKSARDVARLAVRDRGIGMTPEDQGLLFKQFERAGAPRRIPGLGLGLWIVRQIVEAMGGTVRVASRLGEGSTFTVELPTAPATRKAS